MNKTITYYNENAEAFMASTVAVDFLETQEHFLSKLKEGASILDFGCGSGRDTKYFLERGYKVSAADGSAKLCELASRFTGIHVKNMFFQDLDECALYDGIWACSSILHLNKQELMVVLDRMQRALKKAGIIYTSFKYGTFEGDRSGRYFTDFTENSFEGMLKSVPALYIEEMWITGDVRPGRGEEKWLNLILRKN